MSSREYGTPFIVHKDWSFDSGGIDQDVQRHNEKVKEAIKDRLQDLVSDGSIITADPTSKKTIKIPMRSLELPDIRYGEPKDGIGTGDGEGDPQPGDQVGDGEGEGEAGDQPGEEFYEVEFTIEEIQKIVFDDLGLPNIKPRSDRDVESTDIEFNDVRKKRTTSMLDITRTLLENMKRNARETGEARVGDFEFEDFRVRTWEQEDKPRDSAVVIAMADISGSMGEFEKYITRAFCWWAVGFLRTKYPTVNIEFVAHDTSAYRVSEKQFFSRGTGGGTLCSSANEMALDIIDQEYSTDKYNVYPLHFSDGDSWGEADNEKCVDLINKMLDKDISQYAYVQIGKSSRSALLGTYDKNINDSRFKGIMINKKDEVFDALKEVFHVDKEGK